MESLMRIGFFIAIVIYVFGFFALPANAQSNGKELYDAAQKAANANDKVVSLLLYMQSCDAKYGAACVVVGQIYRSSPKAPKIDETALKYFILGCEYGRKTGCIAAGNMIEDGIGAPKSRANSLKYYELACNGGEGGGCFSRGLEFDKDNKPIISSIDISFIKKACDFYYTIACEYLGNFMLDGIGTTKDEKGAIIVFETACEFDNGLNCYYAAKMYESGKGVVKSTDKAKELALKACDNSVAEACEFLESLK